MEPNCALDSTENRRVNSTVHEIIFDSSVPRYYEQADCFLEALHGHGHELDLNLKTNTEVL